MTALELEVVESPNENVLKDEERLAGQDCPPGSQDHSPDTTQMEAVAVSAPEGGEAVESPGSPASLPSKEEEAAKAVTSLGSDHKAGDDEGEGEEAAARYWCCPWFTERLQVYTSHFLSSWGDRMWMFAGGLFLLEVTPGSLRLAAVYGAALSLTVIVLGAPVGRWIDRTSRLRATQISLSVQNLMVCVCAGLLVLITSQPRLFDAWDGWVLVVAEAGVIVTACVAQIGTLGCKLAIEKDWIMVICGQDKTRLARMNSVLRTVDLSTEVMAPVIVGTVMTSFGLAVGGIVIAAWNVGSLLVEYGLLHHLFYSNPDLQKAKVAKGEKAVEVEAEGGNGVELQDVEQERKRRRKGMSRTMERLALAWGAWRVYMRHPVRNAGLGLALLFMTVLAFDNYSRAFVYDSGVSETVLGVLTAVASLFGIFGSLAFPVLRTRIGVVKTGLVGFTCETLCLTLCVASVFAPGSPFDASAIFGGGSNTRNLRTPAKTSPTQATPLYTVANASSVLGDPENLLVSFNTSLAQEDQDYSLNITQEGDSGTSVEEEQDFTFVILFMTGIITSRFGLWVADLTVTQILQENVEESHRGAINGVQSSLNQSLDLLRSILIIILPKRETFGFLILLSFIFVAMALMMFAFYSRGQPQPPGKVTGAPEGQQLKAAAV